MQRYIKDLIIKIILYEGVVMGGVVEMFFFMLVIAGLAFAPLGYFIYMYSMKSGEPFGETEPHGDSESLVLNMAEQAINKLKSLIAKK